jgi:hypothetical protein
MYRHQFPQADGGFLLNVTLNLIQGLNPYFFVWDAETSSA